LGSGTEEIKQKYLPDLASGRKIGALAITEPEAGSDAGSIRTTAVRKGDRYILNGTKCFITSGNVAGTILTYARTGGPGPKGISAFVVENEFPGFSVGKVEKKLGIRGSTTAELIFKDCEVPLENRLGEEGDGFGIMVRGLTKSRFTVGAISLGIARGAFEAAVRYANERKQFGKRILEFQGMQFMFADMATKIEAARSLVYRGGALVDAEEHEYAVLASMAKLFASDIAVEVTSMAVQAFGGYGFIRDYPVERSYRDAKITQIFEGTNQIQRMIIGRHFIE
jgi:alkylation response protein AidB-like acyl-CoA dehydrogenase